MKRFFSNAAIVIGLSATATFALSLRTENPTTTPGALFATEGAFRDGLYLGKRAADHGEPQRIAIGRWSAEHDRLLFAAGYRRGYDEVLVSASSGR